MASIDFDVDDYLEDASTEALMDELLCRNLSIPGVGIDNLIKLAELVAAGENKEALELIEALSDRQINAGAIQRAALNRAKAA